MFVRSVFASGAVADIWFRDDRDQATEEAADIAIEHLGVTRQELVALLDTTAAELQDNARIFDVPQADPKLAESILEQSKEILLLRTLQTMRTAAELQRATETLESRARELEEMSRRDDLTGLYNRMHFKEMLADELREAARRRWPLTLMIIDLDHFKRVNDTYGHQSGDEVLTGAATILESCFRSTDICARYGGEEFSVLLPGTDLEGARIVCERLVRAFQTTRHQVRGGQSIVITASIGIASLGEPESFEDIDTFVDAADRALYAAKHAGRNQFAIHGARRDGSPDSKVS